MQQDKQKIKLSKKTIYQAQHQYQQRNIKQPILSQYYQQYRQAIRVMKAQQIRQAEQKLLQKGFIKVEEFHQTIKISIKLISDQAIMYDVTYGYYKTQINVFTNRLSFANVQRQVLGKGTFAKVKKFIHNKKYIAAKVFENTGKQLYVQQTVIKEVFMTKFAGALKAGPQYQNLYGFDILMLQNSWEFVMQCCDQTEITAQMTSDNFLNNLYQNLVLLHHFGFIHLDIKPQNIAWSSSQNKYIFIDFGFASFIKQPTGEKSYTFFRGTLHYSNFDMKKAYSLGHHFVDLYHNDLHCLKVSQVEHKNILAIQLHNPFQDNSVKNKQSSSWEYFLPFFKVKFHIFKSQFNKAKSLIIQETKLIRSFIKICLNQIKEPSKTDCLQYLQSRKQQKVYNSQEFNTFLSSNSCDALLYKQILQSSNNYEYQPSFKNLEVLYKRQKFQLIWQKSYWKLIIFQLLYLIDNSELTPNLIQLKPQLVSDIVKLQRAQNSSICQQIVVLKAIQKQLLSSFNKQYLYRLMYIYQLVFSYGNTERLIKALHKKIRHQSVKQILFWLKNYLVEINLRFNHQILSPLLCISDQKQMTLEYDLICNFTFEIWYKETQQHNYFPQQNKILQQNKKNKDIWSLFKLLKSRLISSQNSQVFQCLQCLVARYCLQKPQDNQQKTNQQIRQIIGYENLEAIYNQQITSNMFKQVRFYLKLYLNASYFVNFQSDLTNNAVLSRSDSIWSIIFVKKGKKCQSIAYKVFKNIFEQEYPGYKHLFKLRNFNPFLIDIVVTNSQCFDLYRSFYKRVTLNLDQTHFSSDNIILININIVTIILDKWSVFTTRKIKKKQVVVLEQEYFNADFSILKTIAQSKHISQKYKEVSTLIQILISMFSPVKTLQSPNNVLSEQFVKQLLEIVQSLKSNPYKMIIYLGYQIFDFILMNFVFNDTKTYRIVTSYCYTNFYKQLTSKQIFILSYSICIYKYALQEIKLNKNSLQACKYIFDVSLYMNNLYQIQSDTYKDIEQYYAKMSIQSANELVTYVLNRVNFRTKYYLKVMFIMLKLAKKSVTYKWVHQEIRLHRLLCKGMTDCKNFQLERKQIERFIYQRQKINQKRNKRKQFINQRVLGWKFYNQQQISQFTTSMYMQINSSCSFSLKRRLLIELFKKKIKSIYQCYRYQSSV